MKAFRDDDHGSSLGHTWRGGRKPEADGRRDLKIPPDRFTLQAAN